MINELKKNILKTFEEVYGYTDGVRVFFAPGRVNLIGEHIDYSGGHVLPCALTLGTYAAVKKRSDTKLRFYSDSFSELGIVERDIGETEKDKANTFSNYPLSVIYTLKQDGHSIPCGFDVMFSGNLPYSSGLSSSASVEVLTAYLCRELYGLHLSDVDLATVSKRAENDFIGVACGIMDQFSIAMGKQDNAIYLDTGSLKYRYVPLVLKDESLVIACSNKKRMLGESKYNERRAECEKALADIKKKKEITALCELSDSEFDAVSDCIEDETAKRRARHAVYENSRTVQACRELELHNLGQFGKLMNESHESLRNDYEVTGKELDTLAFSAWEQEGVIGSRMTGAGFGGCTVSIVKNEYIAEFIRNVGKAYAEQTDYKADFYVASVGNGPCEI